MNLQPFLSCMHVYEIIQLYPEMFFRKFVNTRAIHLCVHELNRKYSTLLALVI